MICLADKMASFLNSKFDDYGNLISVRAISEFWYINFLSTERSHDKNVINHK